MLTELKTTDLTRYIIITKPVINLNKVIDQLRTTNHLYTEKTKVMSQRYLMHLTLFKRSPGTQN